MPSLPKKSKKNVKDLKNKVCLVTGAAGLLGFEYAQCLLEAGARVCLLDINAQGLKAQEKRLKKYQGRFLALTVDITQEESLRAACGQILKKFGAIDVLINNAANNPKVEKKSRTHFSRFEHFSLEQWDKDCAVGLKGAFLCCKIFGAHMARARCGVIVNIASDLSVIAPDQRIYREEGLSDDQQPVKPVTYAVVKTGLIGLTRYLATYWADKNIRVNALSPGGVFAGQSAAFVKRLTHLIPMGRMAGVDEYRQAIIFLCSDASRYMTGQNLVMDGGRSVW